MRPPSDMPQPSPIRRTREGGSGRGRTIAIIAVVVLFILFSSLRGIAGFYTDFLWFDSLGYDGVFTGVLGAKVALAAIFIVLFFAVCWVNLFIADRIAPTYPPAGPEQEVLDRFRDAIGHRVGLFRIGVAFLLALIAGTGMSGEWRSWLLFVNGGTWGAEDAQFGTDLGFYIFRLPFLTSVADWAFASLLIILVATIAAHFANGGIRVQPAGSGPGAGIGGPQVTSAVKGHISVLLGAVALVRAFGYYLERYELTTSTRGFRDGAGYTDVNAELPALNLLILISLSSVVLFIVNIWRRGWVMPILGVGLWGLVVVVVGGIYPQVVQNFSVNPNELTREAPFIDRNIAATREALALGGVETIRYDLNTDRNAVDLTDDATTVRNIRLWDPSDEVLGQTFGKLQAILPYYSIEDVDVDRYIVDDQLTQVVLAARELDSSGIPNPSWEAQHVTYTHGYGIVLAPGTTKTATGAPDFKLSNVPVRATTDLTIDKPQLYFGEGLDGFVITGAGSDELDYEGEGTVTTRYDGADGVGIGGFFRRLAFMGRFGDFNLLITDLITADSKIHFMRDVRGRVEALAPFLQFDADPYPVLLDGNIVWVIDGYTTTDRYPYAQRADRSQLESESGLRTEFNYVRNSIKAVVDAYDGSVNFFIIDDEDPIIRAWAKAFPDLFSDEADLPEGLREHFRYPEDLFRVQTSMWGQYHVDNATTFFSNNDAWNVAADPGTTGAAGGSTVVDQQGNIVARRAGRIEPYYLLTKLPGEDTVEFVMIRPFVPTGSDNNQLMTAFMVARSDAEHYGELITYEMPRDRRPSGPQIVGDDIQSDDEVSESQTLLGQNGSQVKFGNLILTPVDDSLLWVRPFYVESSNVEIPTLEFVIAVFEGEVAFDKTLEGALRQLFGTDVPSFDEVVEGGPDIDNGVDGVLPPPEPENPGDPLNRAAELLIEAEQLDEDADELLASGDLGGYQSKVEEARRKRQAAFDIIARLTTTTSTSAPAEQTTSTVAGG